MNNQNEYDLASAYHELNERFFNGELPCRISLSWMEDSDDLPLAKANTSGWGTVAHIGLSERLKSCPNFVWFALLHEMVHIKFLARRYHNCFPYLATCPDHGPEFKEEVKRLIDDGAFDGVLW